MVQPVGLVASARALAAAGAFIDRAGLIALQQKFEALTEQKRDEDPILPDLPSFCLQVLGWEPADLAGAPGGPELPDSLAVSLQEYGDHLSPTYAVPDPDRPGEFLMLIEDSRGADRAGSRAHRRRQPMARDTAGAIRSSATRDRRADRPALQRPRNPPRLCSARRVVRPSLVSGQGDVRSRRPSDPRALCHMLLSAERLFSVPAAQRLPRSCARAASIQTEVSTTLAEQVLEALNELLSGFSAADRRVTATARRRDPSAPEPRLRRHAQCLLRLVFILYAEERGMLPVDGDLSAQLFGHRPVRASCAKTMPASPTPWTIASAPGRSCSPLFRLIFDGASHGKLMLPARHGRLFDPDAYPFLEGRPFGTRRVMGDADRAAARSDGVVYRVLGKAAHPRWRTAFL